jgi:gamma-glutamyltranspeptidase / glutathione hydrolase
MNPCSSLTALGRGRARRGGASLLGWVAPVLCALLIYTVPDTHAQAPRAQLAVSSENARSTNEALKQLRLGGNAIDAAVAAAFVAGVVSPTSSGIGGGCFINVFDPTTGTSLVLDAREAAPKGLVAEEFEQRPFSFPNRGKWVGVPGEVKGLYEVHRRLGRRTWKEVVAPAIDAAEGGFMVSPHLAMMTGFAARSLEGDPSLKALWLPLRKQGSVAKNPKLGATLRRIAQEGPNALYEGNIASEIVNTVRAHGGALSLEDLKGYQVKERPALRTQWEGLEVLTMPAPSSGGLLLAQTLSQFSRSELQSLGFGSPAYQHALAETFRAALADRMSSMGDPDFGGVPAETLLAPERMRARRARLSMDRTHALGRFATEEHGTHHLVTRDAEGRVVSLTTTVNRVFGAKLTAPESHVVLNDELNDFTLQSDAERIGLSQSPNRPQPGARPLSSMTPTLIVKDGQVVMAAGGSGGLNIAPEVTQAVLAHLVFGMLPADAVSAERFQVPLDGPSMLVLPSTALPHREELERRGEVVGTIQFNGTAVQMVSFDGKQAYAGADPRKHGLGSAVPAGPARR